MELSLDLSLSFVPNTISLLVGDVSGSNRDSCEKLRMLDDFLKRLEDEMKKIEAFKRELPICMLLVNDAVTRLKEEKVRFMGMQDLSPPPPPVAEEFTPTVRANNNGVALKKMGSSDKKNWMRSAQLWSTETKSRCEEEENEEDRSVPENPIHKNRIGGGALFHGNSFPQKAVTTQEISQVPSFTLMTPAASELMNPNKNSKTGWEGSSLLMDRVEKLGQPQQALVKHQLHLQQNPRKQRRCWSPELHRRFVDALQQLGGAQVATPKQIRELMQVESLTNDEVKSHLQKYRLHVRRFPVASAEKTNDNGLWMTKDQCAKDNSSQSGSPQGPLLLRGSVRVSVDAEDEQSDCRNWKDGIHHHQLEAENQSL